MEYKNSYSIGAGTTASVLGDDILISETNVSQKHLVNVFTRFGMIVNVEKSGKTKSNEMFEFLGYVWDKHNRPIEFDSWYISHLCIPSRFLRSEDIPISLLQTFRAITICMVLYKGIDTFERLIGNQDKVWVDLKSSYYKLGKDPLIHWVSEDQRMNQMRIPLSDIISKGWLAFVAI